MSIQTQIDRIKQNVANTYAVLDALGCELPEEQNSDNLATTSGTAKAVLYKEQNLTDEQKAQARTNVGAASAAEVSKLSEQVADLLYEPIDITSITNNVGNVEMGSKVTAVTVSWILNKEPVSQNLDGETLEVTERSKSFTGLSVTSNRTFTLNVSDEREATDTGSTSIQFRNGTYHGTVDSNAEINSALILSMTKTLSTSKAATFTVNAGTGKKILYAIPTRYGTPNFNVGGFDGGFAKAKTFSFTNASGYTESYDVWLSENTGLGNTTVKVT